MAWFGVWFGAKLSKGAKLTSKGLVLGAVFGAWCGCYARIRCGFPIR